MPMQVREQGVDHTLTYYVDSESVAGKVYAVRLAANGREDCTCPSYHTNMLKGDRSGCKHIDQVWASEERSRHIVGFMEANENAVHQRDARPVPYSLSEQAVTDEQLTQAFLAGVKVGRG